MTTTHMTENPTFTVRGSEDLVALAPIMLGFVPADSVVLETFAGARPFHARLDLPDRRDLDRASAEAIADTLLRAAHQHRVPAVALLFYSDDPGATDRAWRALRRRCARFGIEVLDAMRVEDGRYYPLRGDRRLRESGVPFDLTRHRFTVQAVAAGMVTRASREELLASVSPDADAQADVARRLLRQGSYDAGVPEAGAPLREATEWARGVTADHVADDTRATGDDLARLVWLLQAEPVRRALWSGIERSTAEQHAAFWSDVVRCAPDALAATPAALLAWSAWRAGNGALAWIAVDRCREVAQDDGLAETVARALEGALPPEAADTIGAEGMP